MNKDELARHRVYRRAQVERGLSPQPDQEITNLTHWLAEEQGCSPERALKRAVLLAAYIQEITSNQGGTLLIRRADGRLGEILLPGDIE